VPFSARRCAFDEIAEMRDAYRAEMNCQVIHDSLHARPGWSEEYALELDASLAGYGSVAVGGPWRESAAPYEFYVLPEHRSRIFEAFETLLAACRPPKIETQTNDQMLSTMLHTYSREIEAEAILFGDGFATSHQIPGARVRRRTAADVEELMRLELDEGAGWVLEVGGQLAGAGGVLFHYNRPYGDVYMKIAESFRRRGLGTYLVQELKAACREGGSVPAARCNVRNEASRRTLQKAGFVPCGNLISGKL
jgi:GNAT superfamily N-acetyltransferase